jgi:hypothetical protein
MNNIKSKYFTQKIKKEESLFQEKVRIIPQTKNHAKLELLFNAYSKSNF